jgi:hypothetical protein
LGSKILLKKFYNVQRFILTGMPKRFFKKKCFLMSVLENTARPKKLITSGKIFDFGGILTYASGDMALANKFCSGISFTGFYFVHLAGGQKMIGIIMETSGLTLLVLYLGACLEWFVMVGSIGGFLSGVLKF